MSRSGPEAPGKEEKLSSAEVFVEAKRLLGAFKENLRTTPEFSNAVVDGYFSEEPYDRSNFGHVPVEITRGGFRYSISYVAVKNIIGRTEHELQIIRERSGEKQPGDLTEEMDLLVEPNSARIRFMRGTRDSDEIWNEEGLELHISTPTAVENAEAFLRDLQGTT
ncbi:MAG: hypothetical protein A2900_05585 [Candidatus Chisholmbacteria bacterium RIFCSPLOWO2_01_FULL_50_28]|uniref:Uncharacterized protein n=1 Tax=Candidatus Chisholmbacteria bacterium RIFCSPHIGHO2_01_FULL_52_32 TaxID=1797591 RepID=A0A1G1VRT1_9BACT|nr:MAG: hypothetical protein A2786_01160 [Candidatus Chisholmbacteria bacterium RIFCSPHIGHO2_01_FULL_52_32]OGY20514.1 MAG: hypothetical protein A2900_05585 [Candidatus Chisholmbacteria bacterium RIFCSPLOWO2_01_FULL_50_28]